MIAEVFSIPETGCKCYILLESGFQKCKIEIARRQDEFFDIYGERRDGRSLADYRFYFISEILEEMQIVGRAGVIPLGKLLGFGRYSRISREKQSVSLELLFCCTWTSNGILVNNVSYQPTVHLMQTFL